MVRFVVWTSALRTNSSDGTRPSGAPRLRSRACYANDRKEPTMKTDPLHGSFVLNGDQPLISINHILDELTDDEKANVGTDLAAMVAEDTIYAQHLADLRRAVNQTQVDIAHTLGITQPAVAAIEKPGDMLISTLQRYIGAINGHAELHVTFDDHTSVTVPLHALTS